ncbi:GNAT family N-acetyltransferase [Kocuria sp. cx-455]|uniref:GNAT family N-acetyltransferase n=1 Tax=Kocuria sp. cx-455 TaxID=2771377 RepID=UPI0016851B5C|nr:GNAT family N-acetyltransferase [Kocuria sp. cx-455]MBD2765510.1 GNAT family N-acetyltransferase [Kocuria sp. cx-455]
MSGTITLIAQTSETKSTNPVPSRQVTEEDIPALSKLFFEAYASTTAAMSQEDAGEIIQGVFDSEYGPFLPDASPVVEDDNGKVIAAAMVLERRKGDDLPAAPYLFELFTASSHRRRGLAEQLVREAMTKLYNQGYEEVCLRIAEDNSAALALYLTLDFNRWIPDSDDL